MLWLGSYDSSFVNGEVMIIDGGLHITSSNYGFGQCIDFSTLVPHAKNEDLL